MKTLWVMALVCLVSVATQGCKMKKRQPVPGPQVHLMRPWAPQGGERPGQTASADGQRGPALHGPALQTLSPAAARASGDVRGSSAKSGASEKHIGAAGIAWFQGSVEEAFSRPASGRSDRCPC